MTDRFAVAFADNGRPAETDGHPDREAAQQHADRLNANDPGASAAVIEYPW